jgi:hypothetical protein
LAGGIYSNGEEPRKHAEYNTRNVKCWGRVIARIAASGKYGATQGMTEIEWLASTDLKMLDYLRGQASYRKLRLFCIAAFERSVRYRGTDILHQHVLRSAQLFADGEISRESVLALAGKRDWALMADPAIHAALMWATEVYYPNQLLHDIIGNPFRPSRVDASWKTPTVQSIAEAIYPTDDFTRMPILADALEDAGCTDTGMLEHCRKKGEHMRGCWVVDLLLGKS